MGCSCRLEAGSARGGWGEVLVCGPGVPAQPPSCPWSPAATSWESESRGPVPGPVRLCIWGTRGPTARTRGSGPPIHLGWLGVRHPGFALTSHAGEPWGKQRRKRLPEGHRHGRRPPRRVCASGGPRRGWGGLRRGPPIPLAPRGSRHCGSGGRSQKRLAPRSPVGSPVGSPGVQPTATLECVHPAPPQPRAVWGSSAPRV